VRQRSRRREHRPGARFVWNWFEEQAPATCNFLYLVSQKFLNDGTSSTFARAGHAGKPAATRNTQERRPLGHGTGIPAPPIPDEFQAPGKPRQLSAWSLQAWSHRPTQRDAKFFITLTPQPEMNGPSRLRRVIEGRTPWTGSPAGRRRGRFVSRVRFTQERAWLRAEILRKTGTTSTGDREGREQHSCASRVEKQSSPRRE